jgi:predicted permease
MSFLRQDLLYTLRSLRKAPGFTIVVVLTLALGIGANTAIFSVVENVVLAPLPYAQPDQLVTLYEKNYHASRMGIAYADFQDWRRDAHSFKQMALFKWSAYSLTGPGSPEHMNGKEVSAGFFSMLGVRMAHGRDFTQQEDQPGGAAAVIISDRIWRDRFDGSAGALGKVATLNGRDYTVVGVLPKDFHFVGDNDIFTPIGQTDPVIIQSRTIHASAGLARLKPGVNAEQAQAELNTIQQNIDNLYPAEERGLSTNLEPFKQRLVADVRGTLLTLLGAVGLVLLIACANVASLLLARSASRTREFAIRSALGASHARLIRPLLTESILLALCGGALGLLVANGLLKTLVASVGENLPRPESIGLNGWVLLFTFGISIAVGILFGLAPALKAGNAIQPEALKEKARTSTSSHRHAQSSLVVVQMALTLVLLMGAGLLLRTIARLWKVNPGFDAQNVITFKVGISPSIVKNPANMRVAYQQMIERIREIPGVQAADISNLVPLTAQDNSVAFWVGPHAPTSVAEAPRLLMFWTGPDYLNLMGIPLLQGRFISPQDTVNSPPVVVIDSVFARAYFHDKDPVGQTISVTNGGSFRVIGVVGHVAHWGLDRPDFYTQNQVYAPYYQLPDKWLPAFGDQTVIVRTTLNAASAMPLFKAAIYGVDGSQPIYDVQTMQQIVSESMSTQRLPMILLGAFAGLALLLASVGIYGVISYSVAQRVHEIGIRMALGAEKNKIFRMVIGQGLRLALFGLATGTVMALLLTRLLTSFSHLLYGVRASDPLTFAAVTFMLASVAILACYLPARRAMRVDPMIALRDE